MKESFMNSSLGEQSTKEAGFYNILPELQRECHMDIYVERLM